MAIQINRGTTGQSDLINSNFNDSIPASYKKWSIALMSYGSPIETVATGDLDDACVGVEWCVQEAGDLAVTVPSSAVKGVYNVVTYKPADGVSFDSGSNSFTYEFEVVDFCPEGQHYNGTACVPDTDPPPSVGPGPGVPAC